MLRIKGIEIGKSSNAHPGIEKFFDILEEVNKEEQTTIETLLASLLTKQDMKMPARVLIGRF